MNRNKRSLGLDLRSAEGKDVLLRLLEDADVIIENYKLPLWKNGGLVMRKFSARNSVIHCRISGFGADGPYGGSQDTTVLFKLW